MPDPLLVTKVSLPKLRHILVPRQKVFKQLCEGVQDGHLLTLVSAPAGYGKTTTIRMWVEAADYPVAWFTVEKSDNDLKQFLAYVLTALQLTEDDLGQAALEGLHGVIRVDKGFSLSGETNTVVYDPSKITVPEMENALKKAGTYRGTID